MNKLLLLITALAFFACTQGSEETQESNNETMKPLNPEVKLVLDAQNILGEGSIWNHKTKELWWIDIEGQTLNTYNPKTDVSRTIDVKERIGTVVPSQDGLSAILALQTGIWKMDMKTEEKSMLTMLESDTANIRLNDGKCDPAGRLWVGSMHLNQIEHAANLFQVTETEQQVSFKKMQDSVTISNGIIWSLDEKTMYYIDTKRGNVRAYDYDKSTGDISNERVVITVSDTLGYPDGMTIDNEGMLWIALWNGDCVSRWNPNTGELLQTIPVPAHNISSCAFGGENLDILYITSAKVDMTEEELKAKPNSGGVFKVVPGVKGVKSYFFGN
ncbi:MAG: sugar lactone lactonase YvrE [Saprospiraceae bacterium]|jgi:sugar lactone lactonase YvrE